MTWHVGIMATGDEVKAAASAPASGGPRRRWVIVIAMLLAVAAVILWRWPESGPRYRGQGVGAYFPVWHWPSARRTGSLYGFPEDAGADAVPFLIEVTRLPESGLRDWLAGLYWDPLPSSLQRWIPRPTYVEETRQLARTQLQLRLQRPDCLHEMLRRFDDLPPDTGALLLAQAGSLRSHPKEVLPLLRRLLHGTNADRQEAAASAVLDLGDGGRPLLPDLLAYLETLEVPKGNPGPQSYSPGAEFGKWQLWCLGLGALEVAGQSAAPLLEILKTNDDVNIRAAAGLARARVRGEPGAVRQFLESEVLPAGLPATVAFMRVMWWEHGVGLNPVAHGNAPVDDLLPVWISLLLANHNTSGLAPPAPVPDQATGETVSQQVRGLRLTAMWAIRRYGTNAVPVAPALAGLLQDPDELIREEAADALGGIGPVAPETIPRLVSALADPWLFDLLVTLVGDYGRSASNAAPILELVAAGQLPPGWTNRAPLPATTPSLHCEHAPLLARRLGGGMWWAEMTPDNVLAYLRDRDAKRLCGLAPVGEDGRPRVRMEPTLRQRAEQSLSRIRRSEAGKGHAEGRTVGAPPR